MSDQTNEASDTNFVLSPSIQRFVSELRDKSYRAMSKSDDLREKDDIRNNIAADKISKSKFESAINTIIGINDIRKIELLYNIYNKAIIDKNIKLLSLVCKNLHVKIPMNVIEDAFEKYLDLYSEDELDIILNEITPDERFLILYKFYFKNKTDRKKTLIIEQLYYSFDNNTQQKKDGGRGQSNNEKPKR